MALTNNTKYRRINLTINKRINNSLVTTDGFPKVHTIKEAFGAYPVITDQQLETLTDGAFATRLNDFYTHIESLYTFFNRNFVLNPANGTDAVSCPLDNTAPPETTVSYFGPSLESLFGGTFDDHITWSITLSSPATIDTPYSFEILIKDKNGNPIRYELAYGVVPAGSISHYSLDSTQYIYVPEVYDPLLGHEISVDTVPGTLQI